MNTDIKERIKIEFPLHTSSSLLFNYIGSTEGLGEWFADEIIEKGEEFTFKWGKEEEKATLIRYKEDSLVRFRWDADKGTKYYFEMAIIEDDITNDISLQITDFCLPNEKIETELYWESLIDDLKEIIGS